jgi:hypothetical protein
MRIMPRRSAKPTVVAKTAERKVEHTFSGKRIRVLHQVQRDKTPVDTADAQMLGQVVLKLVTTLSQRQPELVRSS